MVVEFKFYLNRQGIQGRKGDKGDAGFTPTISVLENTLNSYKLTINNEFNSFETPNLRGDWQIVDNGGVYIQYNGEEGTLSAAPLNAATTGVMGAVRFATDEEVTDLAESVVVSPADVDEMISTAVSQDLTDLQTQVATNTTDITQTKSDINILQGEVVNTQADVAELDAEVSNLNTQVNQKQNKLVAGSNVTLTDNADNNTTTIDVAVETGSLAGLKGDYASTYGIIDAVDPAIIQCSSESKTVTVKGGLVIVSPPDKAKTTLASDMTYDIQATDGVVTLFAVDGYVTEAEDVYYQEEEPVTNDAHSSAWFDGKQWYFKSNDTGNVWRSGENYAVAIQEVTVTSTGVIRNDSRGFIVLNKFPVSDGSGTGNVTAAGDNTFSGANTFELGVNLGVGGGAKIIKADEYDQYSNLEIYPTPSSLSKLSINDYGMTFSDASGTSKDVTMQGNKFNLANQLVQLDSEGKLPVLDGSQLINMQAYTEAETDDLLKNKQNKLIQGDNVTLTDNEDGTTTISASGGGGEAPANMVTTDTTQTITGFKTYKNSSGFSIQSAYGQNALWLNPDGSNNNIISMNDNSPATWGISAAYTASSFAIQNPKYLGTAYYNDPQGISTSISNPVLLHRGTLKEGNGVTFDTASDGSITINASGGSGGSGDVVSTADNTLSGANTFTGNNTFEGQNTFKSDVYFDGGWGQAGDIFATKNQLNINCNPSGSGTIALFAPNIKVGNATGSAYWNLTEGGDFSTVATTKMAYAVMPSDRYIDLTLGDSGTAYIAPANGYFLFRKVVGVSTSSYITLINDTSSIRTVTTSPTAAIELATYIPAKQGDSVRVGYNATGTGYLKFIYAEGVPSS